MGDRGKPENGFGFAGVDDADGSRQGSPSWPRGHLPYRPGPKCATLRPMAWDRRVFHVRSPSGFPPLLVGAGIVAINTRLGWDLHGVPWYFFGAAAVCFGLSFRRYAEVAAEGLVLYRGPAWRRNRLAIRWDQVQRVETRRTEVRAVAKSIRVGDIPYGYPAPALRIRLVPTVAARAAAALAPDKDGRAGPGPDMVWDDGGILLRAEPREGFTAFLSALSRHADVKYVEPVDPLASYLKRLPEVLMSLILIPLVLAVLRFLETVF